MAAPTASISAPPTVQPRPVVLTVLTVNVRKGFDALGQRHVLRELREAIREVGADLVFLQQVPGDHRGHAGRLERRPPSPQHELPADSLWPGFAYGRNAAFPDARRGNALLSRWPIVHRHDHGVSMRGPQSRGLLHCRLAVPGVAQEVHAIGVHLGLRGSQRAPQLELLCGLLDRQVPPDSPLIVAGDFNDWRLRAHGPLARCAGLVEAFVACEGRAARTFPARMPLLALDRIYLRNVRTPSLRALPRRPWSRLSGHAPLAVELTL